MSTFDGFVSEFPNIRIDRFRDAVPSRLTQPENNNRRPAALAFLLSHAHSDHLVGLQTCHSAFIYCSAATREIVLRLERRSHRLLFAPGGALVSEKGARALQRQGREYARLSGQLKALPLETPVTIELAPGKTVQVTLFSANHCVGAVMFLIEGRDVNGQRRAVLYTGDVRAEDWWVASLMRHPILLPYVYASGHRPLRRLDAMYLDTTFASKDDPYRVFPSKAEGLAELLVAVAPFPKGTKFYFDAWTFGYEEVWLALAHLLGTRVHVDRYKYGLYAGLLTESKEGLRAPEAFQLIRAHRGNHPQPGCLTMRAEDANVHSCERGTGCEIFNQDFVRITPIISRHKGQEIPELGTGGGRSDLNSNGLELDLEDTVAVNQLIELCRSQLAAKEPIIAEAVVDMLSTSKAQTSDRCIVLEGEDYGHRDPESLTLDNIIAALAQKARREQPSSNKVTNKSTSRPSAGESALTSQRITFPYSRHSSHAELCGLVAAFKPRDIIPCVVEDRGWTIARSMGFLFGHLYDEPLRCSHDRLMLQRPQKIHAAESASATDPETNEFATSRKRKAPSESEEVTNRVRTRSPNLPAQHASGESIADDPRAIATPLAQSIDDDRVSPKPSTLATDLVAASERRSADVEIELRREACNAAAGHGASWFDVHLVSLDRHDDSSQEL